MKQKNSRKVLVVDKDGNVNAHSKEVVKAAETLMKIKGGSIKQKANAKTNPWIAHVKKVAKDKGIKYNDALKIASKIKL